MELKQERVTEQVLDNLEPTLGVGSNIEDSDIIVISGSEIKLGGLEQLELTRPYWLLLPMVLIGGYIGNHMSVKLFSENTVRKMTAILVLFVAARLLWKFSQLVLS